MKEKKAQLEKVSEEMAKTELISDNSKRSFIVTFSAKVEVNFMIGSKALFPLEKFLLQFVNITNTCTMSLPPILVKQQLVELASSSLGFGFMGRVLTRVEFISWLYYPTILAPAGVVGYVHYLAKYFFIIIHHCYPKDSSQKPSKVLWLTTMRVVGPYI